MGPAIAVDLLDLELRRDLIEHLGENPLGQSALVFRIAVVALEAGLLGEVARLRQQPLSKLLQKATDQSVAQALEHALGLLGVLQQDARFLNG